MLEKMRWTDDKAERFQALRHAEARGALVDVERAELDALLADLDADELDALRPALERMDAQAAAIVKEKVELDAKAAELIARMRAEVEQTADEIQRRSSPRQS